MQVEEIVFRFLNAFTNIYASLNTIPVSILKHALIN